MQCQPKRILWPTDFSDLSVAAGRYARAFAEHFKAELHVIHVVPPPLTPEISVMLPAEVPVAVPEPEIIEACEKGLQTTIEQHLPSDLFVVKKVFIGNPWSGVCDYARDNQIDLIVVATHGRTGLSHALIGSTAERIVRFAPCPVLTVKDLDHGFVAP